MNELQPVLLYVRRSQQDNSGELVPSLCVRDGSEVVCIAFRDPPIVVRRRADGPGNVGITMTVDDFRDAMHQRGGYSWIDDVLSRQYAGASPSVLKLLDTFRRLHPAREQATERT